MRSEHQPSANRWIPAYIKRFYTIIDFSRTQKFRGRSSHLLVVIDILIRSSVVTVESSSVSVGIGDLINMSIYSDSHSDVKPRPLALTFEVAVSISLWN